MAEDEEARISHLRLILRSERSFQGTINNLPSIVFLSFSKLKHTLRLSGHRLPHP